MSSEPYIPLQHKAETEEQHRADIVRAGQWMHQHGWVAANEGNLSVRLAENRILATPTGVSKAMMAPGDLIITDLDGNPISGTRAVTSEMPMHLTVYKACPEIHAVVHAHPPIATGFALARRALNLGTLPEVIVGFGAIPLAEYAEPGTAALSEAILRYLPRYEAMLLANHGALACGEDLPRALFRMETVEQAALVTLVAELLGGAKALPRGEIERLFAARGRYGVKSNNSFEPGWPIAAEDQPAMGARTLAQSRQELLSIVEEALKLARSGDRST